MLDDPTRAAVGEGLMYTPASFRRTVDHPVDQPRPRAGLGLCPSTSGTPPTKEDFDACERGACGADSLALIYYLPVETSASTRSQESAGAGGAFVISLAFEIRAAVVKARHELWIGIAITDALCLIMWLQIMYYVRLLVKQWQVDSLLH